MADLDKPTYDMEDVYLFLLFPNAVMPHYICMELLLEDGYWTDRAVMHCKMDEHKLFHQRNLWTYLRVRYQLCWQQNTD